MSEKKPIAQGRSVEQRAGNRALADELPTPQKKIQLSPQESHHLMRVLRKEVGDIIEVLDGKGRAVVGRISSMAPADTRSGSSICVEVEFLRPSPQADSSAGITIELVIGVLKGEAMEWVIEKSVELGVDRVVPLILDHSVVKVDGKGPDFFQSRWQRLADQALKQCGRTQTLEVATPLSLKNWLKTKRNEKPYFFDETLQQGSGAHFLSVLLRLRSEPQGGLNKNWSLLIGPEGGWSDRERLDLISGCERVHLGVNRVLRAETAAIQAVALASAFREEGT
jgi:16S rRNA (uracil1498-N3)-methyltransferase